jgi:hypothetical protein
MVLLIVAILLAVAFGVWLWKGPLAKSADSLQEGGSSTTESYVLVVLMLVIFAATIYMLVYVVG